MKSFVSAGKVMNYSNSGSDIASGDVIVVTGLGILVAIANILANTVGPALADGVTTLAKATGVTFTQGDRVYWDNSAKKLTSVASGNTLAGAAWGSYVSGDTSMDVKLILGMDNDPGALNQAAFVAALAGSLTGSVDGTIADVAAVSTAGGNTYSDAAINTAIASVNLQLKEIQTVLNATLASIKTASLMASS